MVLGEERLLVEGGVGNVQLAARRLGRVLATESSVRFNDGGLGTGSNENDITGNKTSPEITC